jgi:hypothetical protein
MLLLATIISAVCIVVLLSKVTGMQAQFIKNPTAHQILTDINLKVASN